MPHDLITSRVEELKNQSSVRTIDINTNDDEKANRLGEEKLLDQAKDK